MGNEASSSSDKHRDDYPDEFAKFDGIETLGYRVLGVQPHSPASSAGLVSFLDFLVGCNGQMLLGSGEGLQEGDEYDDVDFPALLKGNAGLELELLVHNIKSDSQRLVNITPSLSWGGAGLIGVTIRLDNYGGADERLIRVLSVEHNSPAAIAGLVPMKDYLLGTTSTSFDSDEILAEVLMMHADRIVEFYVYNSESDIVRVVTLMPTLSWGGRGYLGAQVGTGYLHRFPKSCRGTDGTSIERKIRMGIRPTEAVSALAKSRNGGDDTSSPSETVDGEGELVDLTALTDTLSGQAMCFAEQMEMEPEPTENNKSGDNAKQFEQESREPSTEMKTNISHATSQSTPLPPPNEASSIFDGPPPENGIMFTPDKRAGNGSDAQASKLPVPPPPYAIVHTPPYATTIQRGR